MKFVCTMLSILVTLFLISGCSEENPKNSESKNITKNVIRKAVQKPVKEIQPLENIKKETTDIIKKESEQRISREAIKKEPPTVPETKKEEVIPVRETKKEEGFSAQEEKIYITKEGDTLLSVSEKADIYNNPLKWPVLYRDNHEVLSPVKGKNNIYETNLPAGIKLKIISQEEREINLVKRAEHYYVVNLISSPDKTEIARQVVKLIDAGYFVYITDTMIDEIEWYRIRAGFFKTRAEANMEGDKIRNQLNIPDVWTVKIGDIEFHAFGGY